MTDEPNIHDPGKKSTQPRKKAYKNLYRVASLQIEKLLLLETLRSSIARELRVDAIARKVTEGISSLFGYPLVSLYLYQGEALILQHQVGYQHLPELIEIGQNIESQVFLSGKPFLKLMGEQGFDLQADEQEGEAKICVPLIDQDIVLGVLCVQQNNARDLSNNDLRLITAIGENTSNAIWRARLYAESMHNQEALDKERRLLRTVIDNLPDQIFARDRECRFTLSNLSDARMMGVSDPEQLIGKNDLDFFPPDLARRYIADDKKVMESGKPLINIEEPIADADGHEYWIMTTKVPLRDSQDQVIGLVGIARDITKQRQDAQALVEARQQAEEANKAKSKFLANMSHEIRTPLNAILGFSQILLREPNLSPQQLHQLTTINHSGEHLLELINDILELSKIEADRTTIHMHPFDLHGLIRDVESMFQVRVDEKHLDFECELKKDVPHQIISDESKIRQILINLIGNAIKFTRQGRIRCILDGDQIESNRWNLRIKIEDTGSGIAEEDIPTLFQVFQQAPSVHAEGGTGLGLAISQRFAKMLNGDITITSTLGVGSCFTLEIPVEVDPKAGMERKENLQRVTGILEPLKPYRVLMVDDNAESLEYYSSALIPVGFEVMEARNGREALQAWQSWNPDLIIMDIRMPVMNGLEAATHIRKTETGVRTPIIVVTASVFEEDKQKVIDAGVDDYLRKPTQEQELLDSIGKCLGIRYAYSSDFLSSGSRPTSSNLKTSQVEEYGSIPSAMREQIVQACVNADLDQVVDLIEQITPDFPSEAKHLEDLANKLQYDQIQRILQETG